MTMNSIHDVEELPSYVDIGNNSIQSMHIFNDIFSTIERKPPTMVTKPEHAGHVVAHR